MASKIRVLDEHTINKIAAGEVIESPASVVKELVENSMDAGATDICVEIKGGGRQLIRITDNGCGMSRDDAVLCLERHATSKIKDVEDIQSIYTMGFRGEAIPSIASISKFTLLTCQKDEKVTEGTMVLVDGGKLCECAPAARSPGTTIEVKSLFFNVPVRRKFQKSPAHDGNEILKVMTLLALGHPHIKFQLVDNQKTELQTSLLVHEDFHELLKERITAVMGPEYVAGCCPVNIANGDYSLQGYVGLPSYARLNRTGQHLFINRRAVFSPLISFLVREAFGTILPTNKHPIFVLHLTVPGEIVDVNVHPQKKEVRLRQESILREIILKGIQQAVQKGAAECHALYVPIPEPSAEPLYIMPPMKPSFSFQPRMEQELRRELEQQPVARSNPIHQKSLEAQLFKTEVTEKKPYPRVLNTIPSYIILDAQSLVEWKHLPQESLCLVDQKAAHSRVIFENLLKIRSEKRSVQSLLIPYPLQLPSHEAGLLRSHMDTFFAAGIHIQEIGPSSFLIDAIPDIFGNVDIAKLITGLIENMSGFQENKVAEKEIERRIALSASYASVSHQKRLDLQEAQILINRLFSCQTPFFCPQGKSTICYIGTDELVKKFQKGHS